MFKPSIYIYIIFFILLFKLNKDGYWSNSLQGVYRYLKDKHLFVLLYLALSTVIVLLFDSPVTLFLKNNRHPFLDNAANLGNLLGDGNFLFSVLLILIFVFLIFDRENLKILFSISLMSAAFSGIAVNLLKFFFTRARPFVNFKPDNFFAYTEAMKAGSLFDYPYMSMPSGHTITIFAAVIPLVLYTENKLTRTILIGLACTTAFARVYSTVHWTSDVLTGGLLGIIIAVVIFKNNSYRFNQ